MTDGSYVYKKNAFADKVLYKVDSSTKTQSTYASVPAMPNDKYATIAAYGPSVYLAATDAIYRIASDGSFEKVLASSGAHKIYGLVKTGNELYYSFMTAVFTDPVSTELLDCGSQNIPVVDVTVSPESLAIPRVGTAQVTAHVYPYEATNKKVTWKTSKETVATVSSAGLVSGVAVGKATITATSAANAAIKDTCSVSVNGPSLEDGFCSVSGVDAAFNYAVDPICPQPVVAYNGETLVEGQDYSVSYEDNTAVGIAKVVITATGNYRGVKTVLFSITPVATYHLTYRSSSLYPVYTGKARISNKCRWL